VHVNAYLYKFSKRNIIQDVHRNHMLYDLSLNPEAFQNQIIAFFFFRPPGITHHANQQNKKTRDLQSSQRFGIITTATHGSEPYGRDIHMCVAVAVARNYASKYYAVTIDECPVLTSRLKV